MTDLPDIGELPPLARDLAECIGIEAAMALIREYGGGSKFDVPRKPRPGSRLVRTIGQEAAEKFCWFYGGERLDLPRAARAAANAERRHVLAGIQAGEISRAEGARQLGLTVRWVRELVNRHGRDERQGDLFDSEVKGQ